MNTNDMRPSLSELVDSEKEAARKAWEAHGKKTPKKRRSPKPAPKVRNSRVMDNALEDFDFDVASDQPEDFDWRTELAEMQAADEEAAEIAFLQSIGILDADGNEVPDPEPVTCDLCGQSCDDHMDGCPNSPEAIRFEAEIYDRDDEMQYVIAMLRATPEPYRGMIGGDWEHMVALSKTEAFVGGWHRKYWVSRGMYMRFRQWLSQQHQRVRDEWHQFNEPHGGK